MENENIVELNVGGTLLSSTALSGKSFFSALLSGNFASPTDKDGRYFIDRNPKYFEVILDICRCIADGGRAQDIPCPRKPSPNRLSGELVFFGLQAED